MSARHNGNINSTAAAASDLAWLLDVNDSSLHCSHYEDDYRPRLASGIHFFILYAAIGAVAIVGNLAIVRVIGCGLVTINRRTFRFLTLLLCCYELLAAVVLFLLLFALGVGYHNRVRNGTSLVWPGWASEDENVYATRSYSLLKLLISLRDLCVGNEVSTYSLLALDRLLAIAAPVSKRWSLRLVACVSAAGLAATVAGEFGLHVWVFASLAAGGMSDHRACWLLSVYRSVNAVTKAAMAVACYALSLASYIGTGCLMVKRGRSRTVSSFNSYSEASRRQAMMDQMARPLMSLVVGNAVQVVCLLPMMVDNFGFVHLEITAYYLFFANCAAVPCVTLAFNKVVRKRVFSRDCLCCTNRRRSVHSA